MTKNWSGNARARSRNVGVHCYFPEADEKQCDGCSWKKPHFFKVLTGDFRDSLQIPPAFLKHVRVGESGAAVIKDHAGRSWDIKLLRRGNRMIFEKGWKKFVEENGLDAYYFLVFRYDGELHFTVTIFDRSSCEKVQCFDKSPATPAADFMADEDHWQSVDVNMEEKCPRMKAWDAACSLKTTNPTFKKMLTLSHPYNFRIPANAPDASLPKKTCRVKLEDPNGRQWPVKYIKASYSRGTCSLRYMQRSLGAGWHNFSEENCLKERDVCVFEFIAGKKLFKVHIFRDRTE